jgi:hypothetical protein
MGTSQQPSSNISSPKQEEKLYVPLILDLALHFSFRSMIALHFFSLQWLIHRLPLP